MPHRLSLGSVPTAPEFAREIDRVVIAVNRQVGPRHRDHLDTLAREHGLGSLAMLPHYEDFLLAGSLTREIATLRLRYRPAAEVHARLDELIAGGHVTETGTLLGAAPPLRPVLDGLLAARAETAGVAWAGHEDDIAVATAAAGVVADATSDEHVVAVAHRALPLPDDPYLRLEHRLFTLRYVRQHDHAAAWSARGLTAPQMVVMTALWKGHEAPGNGGALAGLAALGYAGIDPPKLTDMGRQVREEVEADTDARSQRSYDALDEATAAGFLAALRRLPGEV